MSRLKRAFVLVASTTAVLSFSTPAASAGTYNSACSEPAFDSKYCAAYVEFNHPGDHFILCDTDPDGFGVSFDFRVNGGRWTRKHQGQGNNTCVDYNYNFKEGAEVKFYVFLQNWGQPPIIQSVSPTSTARA